MLFYEELSLLLMKDWAVAIPCNYATTGKELQPVAGGPVQ